MANEKEKEKNLLPSAAAYRQQQLHSKSFHISREMRCFYETESEIWAGFGTAG